MNELCTKLITLLKEKSLTLSVAESCTGGLISKSITDIAGASSVFYGGVVSYDNSVKEGILKVKADTLKTFGAVSYETAREMALGVKSALNTDIGISTTGIAGPDGGSEAKPVGTVYIGFSYKGITESHRLELGKHRTRDEIRQLASYQILQLLLEKITENY